MGRSTILKFCVLCLIVVFNGQSAQGINCWECVGGSQEAIAVIPKDQTCAQVSRVRVCDDNAPYCMKFIWEPASNGEQIVVRSCGIKNLNRFMEGTNKCDKPSASRTFKMIGHEYNIGLVCICDTDHCNSANISRTFPGIIAFGTMLGIIFSHLCG